MPITFTIPLKAPPLTNAREHWRARARKAKTQRTAAMLKCPKWPGPPLLVVTLTRVATHEMDTDNVQGALKSFRDGIAARLGIDDRTTLVRWDYAQEKCAKGSECVRVTITTLAPEGTSRTASE